MGNPRESRVIARGPDAVIGSEEQVQVAESPTVAVVIPAYNVKNYVREALNSVRQQTVPPDEIIVVDDGSTDGTSEVLADYAELPGFRIVRTKNNGLGPARNLGRALAQSQYVYFFDSDDLIKENFIKRVREIVENTNPDIILFAGETFRDPDCDHPFSPVYRRSLRGRFSRHSGLLTELVRRGEISAQACLYVTKTSLWSEHQLAFPPIIHEDEAVFFPLLALSNTTVVVPEAYFRRRVRAGSIMTSGVAARNVSGVLRTLNETLEFMAREPDLVATELPAWRFRVRQFGLRYVHLCRATGQDIAWGSILASIVTVREFGYLLRLARAGLPERMKTFLRMIKRIIRR